MTTPEFFPGFIRCGRCQDNTWTVTEHYSGMDTLTFPTQPTYPPPDPDRDGLRYNAELDNDWRCPNGHPAAPEQIDLLWRYYSNDFHSEL